MPSMKEYKATCLAAARAAGATPQQVRGATIEQIATYSGVNLGEPNLNFRWWAVRKYVANQRWYDQRNAMIAAAASAFQTEIRTHAGFAAAVVTTSQSFGDGVHFIVNRGEF